MFVPQKCPRCNSEAGRAFSVRDLNRKVSRRLFEYFRCRGCALVFLADIPADLDAYYGDGYYCPSTLEKLKKVAAAEKYQLGMVLPFVKRGRLLEVGPGFGVFAYQAKQAGFDVEVIEKEAKCCSFLSEVVGVKAINSDVPQTAIQTRGSYDVIALWHVIEHLPAAWQFLEEAAKKLNPGGVLLIAAPSPEAFQFKVQGAAWPHVDAPRHVWLIPAATLVTHMAALGLRPVMQTFDDKGARSWNRFGWQRWVMNCFDNSWLQRAGFVVGYFISLLMVVFDRQRGKGSAYTIVFQKGN